MKGTKQVLIAGLFVFASATCMADGPTPMDSNWICTTNASSSAGDLDQAADEKMAKAISSAADAFAFAAANCRDCTTITCEVEKP